MRYARNIRDHRRHFPNDPQKMGSFRYPMERLSHSYRDEDVIYGDRRSNYPWDSNEDYYEEEEYDFDEYYDDDDYDQYDRNDYLVRDYDDDIDYPEAEYENFEDDYDEDPDYRYHAYDDTDEYDEYNPNLHHDYEDETVGGSYNYPYGYRRAGAVGLRHYQGDYDRYPRVRDPETRNYPEYRANSIRFKGNRRHAYKPRSNEWNY